MTAILVVWQQLLRLAATLFRISLLVTLYYFALFQAFDAQRGTYNFWLPTSDGAGVAPGRPVCFFSRVLALEGIQLSAKYLLPPFGLQLHGEVWYQGMLADTFKYSLLHAVSDHHWPTAYCSLQAGSRWIAADSMQMQLVMLQCKQSSSVLAWWALLLAIK